MKLIVLLFASVMFAQPLTHGNALSWTAGVGGDPALGFHVWKSATLPVLFTGTPYATVSPATVTTFSDAAVLPGQTNYYAVTAFNSKGDSLPTNTVTCITPFFIPVAPSSVAAAVA